MADTANDSNNNNQQNQNQSQSQDQDQNVKITLHWLEKSRSQRILWLLEELNIPYELKTYKRGKDMLAPAALKEIHPLGKSPVITVETPTTQPLILAESGAIVEYLVDHFRGYERGLVPTRYVEGKEGQIGGETETWLRYRFYMHYAEGSLMSVLVLSLVLFNIRNAPVPFFIKPITRMITDKVQTGFLDKQFDAHFPFLESQLKTAPGVDASNPQFLTGKKLTAADILMSFPVIAATQRGVISKAKYPELHAYAARLKETDGYKKAVAKIEAVEGEFVAVQ